MSLSAGTLGEASWDKHWFRGKDLFCYHLDGDLEKLLNPVGLSFLICKIFVCDDFKVLKFKDLLCWQSLSQYWSRF